MLMGVYFQDGFYRSHAWHKGKQKHLGIFDTELEAHIAYLKFRVANPRKEPRRKKDGLPTGITRSANGKRFLASIVVKGRNIRLGTFDTVEEAVKVRNKAAKVRSDKYSTQPTNEKLIQMLAEAKEKLKKVK